MNKKSQPSQSGMALIIMKLIPPGITSPFRRVILICFKVKMNKKKPAVAKRHGFNYYEANPSRDHASIQTRDPDLL
jgi:hypothetical protein